MIQSGALQLWLAFSLPAIAAAPLLRRAFPGLRDGGAAVARPAAWLLIAWMAWFTASLPGLALYGTPLVVVATFLLVCAGGYLAWQDRVAWRTLLRREWATILLGEALGLAVFAIGLWLVQWNGDIHPLAERFMDYAILRRLEFSTSFPPQDSWVSGLTLQYYYYGYLVMDCLRRLAGLSMRDFFNPALPGVYATFVIALYGAGMAVGRTRGAGVLAAAGAAILGNYDLARQMAYARWKSGSWKFLGLDWFHTSRVIDGTINETPTFAIFWGDLHPYLIAFPIVVLCVTLGVAALSAEKPPLTDRPKLDRLIALALLVIALGALFPTNSWDYPTFLGLALAALAWPLLDFNVLGNAWRAIASGRPSALPPHPASLRSAIGGGLVSLGSIGNPQSDVGRAARSLVKPALVCGSVAVLTVLAYLFFHVGFGKQVGRGIRLAQRRSDVVPMLTHFGPWFVAIFFWAVATSKDRAMRIRRVLPLPLVALALVAFEMWGTPVVEGLVKSLASGSLVWLGQGLDHLLLRGLAFGVVIAALWVLVADLEGRELTTPEGMSRLLATAAFFVVLVCEFAYVDDFYGGKNERMNTVFKAYIQAWILLGVGCAGLLGAGWRAISGSLFANVRERGAAVAIAGAMAAFSLSGAAGWVSTGGGRVVLLLALPVVFLAYRVVRERGFPEKAAFAVFAWVALVPASAFSFLGDYNRSSGFRNTRSGNEPTLDPLDLFREKLPGDYHMTEWVERTLPPDAVILEASAHAYEWESRVATFTGRPTLIGWKNHESGWRNDWTLATERGKIVDAIYESTDLDAAFAMCRENGIEYVVVGELERKRAVLPIDLPGDEVLRRLGPPLAIQEGKGAMFGRAIDAWERWAYPEFNVWVADGKLLRTDQAKDFPATYHVETFAPADAVYSSDRVRVYKVPGSAPSEPGMSKN